MERKNFNEVYKVIKHPARVALAIVKSNKGVFNPITLEWFMKTSIEPPMFAISIGHTRFSHQCLQNNRFFNLVIPDICQKDFTILSGSKSGKDLDKLSLSGEPWFKGRLAGYPILKNAVASFECAVISQVRSGDHTIFVGEIKYAWMGNKTNQILADQLS